MKLTQLLLALLGLLLASPVMAADTQILLGTSIKHQSKAMGEERVLNVYLPDSYAKSPERKYPVLYLIDGGLDQDFLHIVGTTQLGSLWGRSQEVIVVGIATKDRRRELAGPTADPELLQKYPTAGKSAEFRKYIRDEVKPLIAKRYRTNGKDGVIGESLAGLFIAETYLRDPDLFGAYAAISPSLWWDKEKLSLEADALLANRAWGDHRFYMATADEGAEMRVPVNRFAGVLKASDPTLVAWCHVPRMDLTHSTIYHAVSPQALQFLFPPDEVPDPIYGFDIKCQPNL